MGKLLKTQLLRFGHEHLQLLTMSGNQQDQQQQEQEQPQQVEGQISKEDMERILESLERGEEEVQAKLMKAKSQGKKKKIEKDW